MSGNLQFLNLSGHDQKVARPNSQVCFSFTLPNSPEDNEKKRSRISNLRICNEIANRMRSAGFEAGEAGSATRGAAFTIKLGKFNVVVLLLTRNMDAIVKCDVLTWTQTSRWRPAPPEVVEEGWEHTLKALEKVLRQDLRAESLTRLTGDELADREEVNDSGPPRN